jgi:hypothetical protein
VRRTQAFEATFTITIHRHGEDLTFTEEVARSLTCVAPDFADRFQPGESPGRSLTAAMPQRATQRTGALHFNPLFFRIPG